LPFGFALDKTNGFSIIHFVFMYFIAAYIRLYRDHEVRKGYYIGAYIFLTGIIAASKFSLTYFGFNKLSGMFYEYNSLTVVISSVMLFMYFRSIQVKSPVLNRAIVSVSSLTFGVYLIHEDIFLRGILYNNILHANLYLNTPQFIPVLLITVSGIFTACILIDATRKKLFTTLENSHLAYILNKFITSILSKRTISLPTLYLLLTTYYLLTSCV
ncbi:MAG: hypothetical protein ACM34K_02015, partial [Bacillota bacterium]